MLRKIVILIIAIFIGLVITGYSTKIKIDGLKWLIPQNGGCGDHWAGLPFAYSHVYYNPKIEFNGGVIDLCMGEGSMKPFYVNWFIWTFVVYVGVESGVKIVKRCRSQR